MNDFTFCSPTKFVFGCGETTRLGTECQQLDFKNTLLVYGQGSVVKSGLLERVKESLHNAGVNVVECGGVRPNPEITWVRNAVKLAREHNIDSLVAVGGGSVIDAAKAVSFGVPYQGDTWDFFAQKMPVTQSLPLAVVLTIPAAGSEGSSSCVISNDAENRKVGANGDVFRPRLAIMDPELTFTLPPYQTAAGVTDMIAHICERYFSGVGSVAVTDNMACGVIRALMQMAPRAIQKPDDYEARANIMWAGTLAHNDLMGCGRALDPIKRAGGWESHALEHELSAHHPSIAHGAGLAVIMPAWMRYVWRSNPDRFLSFALSVFHIQPVSEEYAPRDEAVADAIEAAIDELQDFFVSLGMPRSLGEFGLTPNDIDALLTTLELSKGKKFGAFQPLTMEDARAIYLSAF